jgi:hypothetical protein
MRSKSFCLFTLGATSITMGIANAAPSAVAAESFVAGCQAFYVAQGRAHGLRIPPEEQQVKGCTCIKGKLNAGEQAIVLEEIQRVLQDVKAGRKASAAKPDRQPVLDTFIDAGSRCGRA